MSDRSGSRWLPSPFLWLSAGIHLAGAAALALAPWHWPVVAGAVVADHLGLAAGGLWPRSRLLGPNLTRMPAWAAAEGRVALTFDDGPDPAVTPGVLDLLERAGVRATFFCIGHRAERHPELVAEISCRGHRVENHSYHHRNWFAFHGPRRLRREIERTQELLQRITGRAPEFFRAPAGIRNFLLEPALSRAGLRLVSWTVRGFDTVSRRPQRVLRRLTKSVSAGDILLLHDGSAARDERGEPVVHHVLGGLLAHLDREGLRPGPLETEARSARGV